MNETVEHRAGDYGTGDFSIAANVIQVDMIPQGFEFGAVRAQIKPSGKLDLACATAEDATAAAMFTRNRVVAAPVTVGREHLLASKGAVRAVIVNAGNANCATGEPGIAACNAVCAAAAEVFGCAESEVFPSSTGIIGVPLPTEKLLLALPELKASLGTTPEHVGLFARAILTTDTRAKVAPASVSAGGKTVRIFGMAKGAGMIHPRLSSFSGPPHATMLVYVFTDLKIDAVALGGLLDAAVEESFNAISIDGDTSTNDTVLLAASGASGVEWDASQPWAGEFQKALTEVCSSLAHQIVDDGEGVTHVVTLEIEGAASRAEAQRVAKSIAHSPLVKTAWAGSDPNWGRILAAIGNSGVEIDAAKIRIWVGASPVFAYGVRAAEFDKEAVHATMKDREFTVRVDLGMGAVGYRFVTTDLTAEYVRINADYST